MNHLIFKKDNWHNKITKLISLLIAVSKPFESIINYLLSKKQYGFQ